MPDERKLLRPRVTRFLELSKDDRYKLIFTSLEGKV